MHAKRLISALILIPLLFLYIIYLPPVFFLFLVMAVTAVAQYELYAMYRLEPRYRISGVAAGMLLLALTFRSGGVADNFVVATLMVFAVMRLFARKGANQAMRDVSLVVLGIIYVPMLMAYQVKLREFGPQWIIYLDSCIWAADSAAYYVGKGWGKKKLYEAVSPNKTMAGAYASVAGAMVVSVAFAMLFVRELTFLQAAGIGAVVGLVSIVGDLVESVFKRDAGVKDSGAILPGHGGFLDKIDGFVFVTPVVYWILTRIVGV